MTKKKEKQEIVEIFRTTLKKITNTLITCITYCFYL